MGVQVLLVAVGGGMVLVPVFLVDGGTSSMCVSLAQEGCHGGELAGGVEDLWSLLRSSSCLLNFAFSISKALAATNNKLFMSFFYWSCAWTLFSSLCTAWSGMSEPVVRIPMDLLFECTWAAWTLACSSTLDALFVAWCKNFANCLLVPWYTLTRALLFVRALSFSWFTALNSSSC